MAQDVEATADTPPAPAQGERSPARPLEAALARLRELGPGRILAIGTVLLALLAFLAFAALQATAPRYALLFGGLASGDVARIVERLEAMDVPYRLTDSGDAVLVPADEVARLRMTLAQDGLPTGEVMGWELFDASSGLTTTDFTARVNLRRALEGELARTIAALEAVRRARVHLNLPERRLFVRDQPEPSAAVMVELVGGRTLSPRQVRAIRELVAAAVPGLEPARVTVSDSRGRLLARLAEEEGALVLEDAEAWRRAYEERLRAKIVELLERSLGPGRVDAQVSAEVDFDEREVTEEVYDPEGQVARSTRTVEETTDRNEISQEEGVSASANLPGNPPAGAGTSRNEKLSRTEEVVNYEISRTVRAVRARTPRVVRLSVAVQVDGRWETDAQGQQVFRPLPAEELQQIEALVRSAVGLDEERGDRLEVVSRPFAQPEAAPAEEPGLISALLADYGDLLRNLLWALVALLVVLFGLRPLLRRLLPPPEGTVLEAGETRVVVADNGRPLLVHEPSGTAIAVDGEGRPVVVREGGETTVVIDGRREDGTAEAGDRAEGADSAEDEERHQLISLDQVEGKVKAKLVNDVARLVDQYPEEAVRVIRNWLYE